jgi:sugar lactone lactonase YvrE
MDLDDGILNHIAGTGKPGFTGDHGLARQATFNGPKGVAVGPDDALYVADTENNAIRRIDLGSGTVDTIAGKPASTVSGAADTTETEQVQLNRPHGVCVGPGGRIYIGDTLNHQVRRLRSQ